MAKRRKVEYEEGTVECFYCGKPVYENSWRCPNCGKWYREGKMSVIGIIAILAIVAALILFIWQPSFVFGGEEEETEKRFGVLLEASPESNRATPGGYTEWGIQVTSLSNVADNFEFSSQNVFPLQAIFNNEVVGLTSGRQFVNVVRVDVPATTPPGQYDFRIIATSSSDPTENDFLDLTVEVVALSTRTVQSDDKVKCNYIFWTQDDGAFEQSSYGPPPNPISVKIDHTDPDPDYIGVIPGFSEGLLGMRAGETKVVFVPPDKGYQDPNNPQTGRFVGRTLIYQIELVSIDSA